MLNLAALFTTEDARTADAAAIASGIEATQLMQNAASACEKVICKYYKPCPVLIVCGHGNNGGDGKIIAKLLQKQGWNVTQTDIQAFNTSLLHGKELIIDALFGTGLNREVEGTAKVIINDINTSNIPVLSVDIASGVNATTGEIMGVAIRATHTVTFVRPKLGQLLLPGKYYSGNIHIADIGISKDTVLPQYYMNIPSLWKDSLPCYSIEAHKYMRGHTLIMGGGTSTTGAARLAAISALRAGSGLVSVACTPDSLSVYATCLTSVMTKPIKNNNELELLLEDKRINSVAIGCGYGIGNKTHDDVLQILSHKKSTVIDADAISSFKNNPKNLFSAINSPVVLTPHEGEFSRIFNIKGNKIERAKIAAKQSSAVIILKGNDTVIAAPDGRIVINNNAPAWLATAGSGDALTGIIAGLLAQKMPVFEAACAAVWIHGEAASKFGIGLIAEDLPSLLPIILKQLYTP